MNGIDKTMRRKGLRKLACSLLSCVVCVSLNIAGSRIAGLIGANLYLDNVGTLLAAMYGGYLPGVICGYLTNLVSGLSDGVSFFYGVISVLIGLMAGHFAERGWFKSVWKTILAIFAFSIVAGGFSSVITWFLYGLSYGDGITASLAHTLEAGGAAPEAAQLLSNMAIDTIDKAVTVIIVLIIKRLLPDRTSDFIDFEFWQQAPLTDEEREDLKKSSRPRIVSAHAKIAGIMSFVLISAVGVNTWISFVTFRDNMAREQAVHAQGITHLLCRLIDPERIDGFLERGDAAEGYKEAERGAGIYFW